MGGCRCVYRSCQSSTTVSPGLHYFHFPIRDPNRCEEWIKNARKPDFRNLEKERLRNKVVCSLHFEEKCFTNEKHDRLIHNAVPTLGFEEEDANEGDIVDDKNITLIPMDEENTKFALPNSEGFTGISYTICDDGVIPTSNFEQIVLNSDITNSLMKYEKTVHIKPVIKKIKTSHGTIFKKNPVIVKNSPTIELSTATEQIFIKNVDNKQQLHAELIISSNENSNDNIPSYSVSTRNGNVSVQPSSTYILPDLVTEDIENIHNNSSVSSESDTKHFPLNVTVSESNNTTTEFTLFQHVSNEESAENITSSISEKDKETNTEQMMVVQQTNEEETVDNDYINMIKDNSKQIQQLKKLIHKQNKFNRILMQQKPILHRFKRRKLSKLDILDALKEHVKPSLCAILKLELQPVDEVILTDNEEKFIMDLYTENPECYDLLRTKYKWNLPTSEKM